MSITDNENFPRGGKKIVNSTESLKRKHENNLFAMAKSQKPKKARKEKSTNTDIYDKEDVWQRNLNFQGTLSYNKIQNGMLILCCVRHISNFAIQVEFPGLTFANVTINEISDAFTKNLTNQLKKDNQDSFSASAKNIVKVGQLMPAKILSIEATEKGHEVHATVNPKHINSDRKHNSFLKGETVWANVVSELDHGYELTLGINNCRVFLPHKKIETGKKYEIGEVLFCSIHKISTSDVATTLTVSAKKDHVTNFQPSDLSLDSVIPGMKVQLIIEEITPHGVKGQFFDNCFGYIDETQMLNNTKSKKLKEGGIVAAYVLYVEPITKVTYLTLNGLDNVPEPEYAIGKVISACVTSVVNKGLYLKLGVNSVGFVTNRRLLNTLPKDARLDVIQAVRNKYSVGSAHECRILDYNYMQQLYICTLEKKIIKEKIFSPKDLSLAQLVKLKIEKIQPNGLIVKTGHIQGFVPNVHLSNVAYSENIKSKFVTGMNIDGRVLNITPEDNVIFTLKPSLIESDKCLTKIEDAVPNSQFVGFVVQTIATGALIAFYGTVTAWISSKTLNTGNSGRHANPRDYFFLGQVVTVWILGLKDGKLQASLTPSKNKSKLIQVGNFLSGTITRVAPEYLELECGLKKVEVILPTAHLTDNLELCSMLKKVYQPGDKISNLLCINDTELFPIVSRREALAFKKQSLKILKLFQFKKGMFLRCSFLEATESGIYVIAPIKGYSDKIFVSKENINLDGEVKFEKHQSLLGKVLNVNFEENKISLEIVQRKLPKKDINAVLEPLIQTFRDFKLLYKLFTKKKLKLIQHKIGSRVKCKVHEIDSKGNYLVTLPENINGKIPSHLAPSNCSLGQTIEGVVLDHNLVDNLLEICGKNSINQKINKNQDGIINKSCKPFCFGKILLITKFYTVGVLTDKSFNRQLFYSPLCFDKKDLQKDKLKVTVCRRVNNKIIALPKKIVLSLKKDEKKQTKTKQKRKNAIGKAEIIESENGQDLPIDAEIKSEVDSDEEIFILKEKENVENIDDIIEESNTDPNHEDDETESVENIADKSTSLPKESVLSGANLFYAEDSFDLKDESSSDDDEEDNQQNKKKKKLSAAERAEAARKEEERLTQIEKQLADTETTPQSAEQFDRLLLANPNSSELWLQYIAMHVAATELEKARAVGKRAIDTINMTLVKEKFNIWIALLNLENMYGTKESLEKVFEDAVRYNNSLDIYLSVIKMLASSGKLVEMEEKIKKIRTKEKQNTKMWLEVGKVYYTLHKFREARNIKDAALKSILDKKRQFDIIIRFGILEFQLGELEQAIANFETILETYPAKVNIWTIYIDQLVKRNNIDLARKVLERAVSQKFAIKTMKILFQKFITFEEQHGTPEAVQNVKDLAKNYVSNFGVK